MWHKWSRRSNFKSCGIEPHGAATSGDPEETQSGYLCHVTRFTHLVTRFHVTMNVNLEPRHVSARGRHKFVVQHKYVVHVVHVSARGRQMYT